MTRTYAASATGEIIVRHNQDAREMTSICVNCGELATLYFNGRLQNQLIPTQKYRQDKKYKKYIFHDCRMGTLPVKLLDGG